MNNTTVNIGDTRTFTREVTRQDVAHFDDEAVHDVLSTFAITRDAEWAGRLFVHDMKESHEEGIGTFVEVQHKGPAFIGELVLFTSTLTSFQANGEVITDFVATVGARTIATGRTGQRILPKDKLASLMQKAKDM
ncbi:MAG: hypothetical protein RL660_769 [Bacteroidota bacterium]|jgi:predicted thioesterase